MEEEIESLKEIINNAFGVDLSKTTRERKLVDARRVYSKILRDRGYTFELIAESLNKNHATVIHYMSSIDSIILYDKNVRDKYMACKNMFLEGREPIVLYKIKKEPDLFMTIVRLNNDLQESINERKEILTKFVDYIKEYERESGNKLPKFNI